MSDRLTAEEAARTLEKIAVEERDRGNQHPPGKVDLMVTLRHGLRARALEQGAAALRENERLRGTLDRLARRHDWTPDLGRCVCEHHEEWRSLAAPSPGRTEEE